MRILLIAYSFPPFQDAQSLRWYYLINALAEKGLTTDVITIKHPDQDRGVWYFHQNINILRIYPGHIEAQALQQKKKMGVDDPGNREIRKTSKFRIMKSIYWTARKFAGHLLPGDIRTEWFPFAVKYMRKNLRIEDYGCMITSHEPWVDSLLGLYLKKRYKKMKWIADFGDPYVAPYTPKHKLWFEHFIERSIYKSADTLIFTNAGIIQHLQNKYPFLSGKATVIEQGFSHKICTERGNKVPRNEIFMLMYTGTFYREFRNPSSLIKALSMLDFDFKFMLAGRNEQFLKDFEVLGEKFCFLGFIDHFDILRMQKESDVLIHLANATSLQIPGKFYEYLGALTPILCIYNDPDDPTAEIIEKLKCGMACRNDAEEIKKAMNVLYNDWASRREPFRISCEDIYDYSWEKKADIIKKNLLDE